MQIKGKPKHIKIKEGFYFITSHTLDFKPIFKDKKLLKVLLSSFKKVKNSLNFSLYAYVFLLNHFHVILQTTKKYDLSYIMFRLKGFSSREINKKRRIKGKSIWQDRYYDHIIRNERDFEKHFDYIHYNPKKHKLVNKPENWKWSSYRYFLKKGNYEIRWGYTEPGSVEKINYEKDEMSHRISLK